MNAHTYSVMAQDGTFFDVEADVMDVVDNRVEFRNNGVMVVGVVYDPVYVVQKIDLPTDLFD